MTEKERGRIIAQVTGRLSSVVATHYINLLNQNLPGYQVTAINRIIGECMNNIYLFTCGMVPKAVLLDKVNQDLGILEKLVYSI